MEFRIDITDPAIADAQEHVDLIRDANRQPDAAAKWFRGLVSAIYSLERNPRRCHIIPEWREFAFELRHLIYYSHRIVFRIDEDSRRVVIERVFHGRRSFRPEDLS